MSILNVNQIQPVGGGNTITVSANDVNFSGNISIGSSFVGTATTASLATSAQGLTGTPDITVRNIQSGVVTATTFIGDGSGLTGVTASGSGINIKDSGSTVGVAATVDFSTNLNVSPASAGIVTVTVGDTDFSIADKIVHTGDTNTAIRFPAADTFTVETAGSERLRISSGGLVGIGTNNPGTSLEVFTDDDTDISNSTGTNNTNSILRLYNKNGSDGTGVNNYTGIRFDVANGARSSAYLNYVRTGDNQGAFLFKARNAASSYPELLRITSAGSVIIGDSDTDNANAIANDLVVGNTSQRSGITIVSGSGDDGNIFFSDGTGAAALRGQIVYNHTSDRFSFYTAAAERLRIASAGGHRIQCDESWHAANLSECNTEKLALNINQTRQGQTKGIAIGCVGGGSGSTGIQCYDTSNNSANNLELNPFGGNVGVNATSPERKLEVVDTAGSLTYPVAVSNFTNASTGVGAAIDFRLTTGGNTRGELGLIYAGNNNSDGTDFVFKPNDGSTGNIERMRIEGSSGNIGIGTDNPGEPLHVFVGNGGNGEPIALFEHDHGSGGDASIRIEGGASGNPDEVYLELCDKDDSSNSYTMGMNDDITRLRFEYGAKGANNGKQLLTLDRFGAARFNGASGVLRDPTIDNTSYVGLSLWPSGTGGASDYSDNHNISFTQENGNWLDGHSNTSRSSFGMVWNYTSNGTTMATRAGIHYDHRGAERFKFWSSYGDISFKVDSGSSGNETWTTCNKEVMRLSHDGHVLRPTMAAAVCTTTGQTSLSTFNTSYQTIAVNVEGYDNANNFNTSNYRFTAPETGFYQVGCNVQLEGASGSNTNNWMYFYPLVNGSDPATSTGNNHADFDPTVTHYYNWTYTTLLKLSQNDYVEWKYRGNLSSVNLKGGVESTYYFYQVG